MWSLRGLNKLDNCVDWQLEKKSRELSQLQRQVVDLQCRLVEDRNQWQLEVAQLQRHLEDSQRSRLQQKESVSQLLAEVTTVTLAGVFTSLKVRNSNVVFAERHFWIGL